MSNTTTSKLTVLGLAFLVLGVLLPGCGSQMSPAIDHGSVAVKVFEPMCAGVNAAVKRPIDVSDGGGGPAPAIKAAASCASYSVEISGTAQDTEAVLVNFADQEFSVSVSADGTFSASFNVADPALLEDLSITKF